MDAYFVILRSNAPLIPTETNLLYCIQYQQYFNVSLRCGQVKNPVVTARLTFFLTQFPFEVETAGKLAAVPLSGL